MALSPTQRRPAPSAVEQQHQAHAELVKLPLLAAEVQAHGQAFLEGILKWGWGGSLAPAPKGRNANRGGMPDEAWRFPNRGLHEGLFQ